jgi:hypothetical protein
VQIRLNQPTNIAESRATRGFFGIPNLYDRALHRALLRQSSINKTDNPENSSQRTF